MTPLSPHQPKPSSKKRPGRRYTTSLQGPVKRDKQHRWKRSIARTRQVGQARHSKRKQTESKVRRTQREGQPNVREPTPERASPKISLRGGVPQTLAPDGSAQIRPNRKIRLKRAKTAHFSNLLEWQKCIFFRCFPIGCTTFRFVRL